MHSDFSVSIADGGGGGRGGGGGGWVGGNAHASLSPQEMVAMVATGETGETTVETKETRGGRSETEELLARADLELTTTKSWRGTDYYLGSNNIHTIYTRLSHGITCNGMH